jgi:hypothetical protein
MLEKYPTIITFNCFLQFVSCSCSIMNVSFTFDSSDEDDNIAATIAQVVPIQSGRIAPKHGKDHSKGKGQSHPLYWRQCVITIYIFGMSPMDMLEH